MIHVAIRSRNIPQQETLEQEISKSTKVPLELICLSENISHVHIL